MEETLLSSLFPGQFPDSDDCHSGQWAGPGADERAETLTFRGVDDIHVSPNAPEYSEQRIPTPIIRIRTEMRTPPQTTPAHMNRATLTTPAAPNRPRKLDAVDFTRNSHGDVWVHSSHSPTEPDQSSRSCSAGVRSFGRSGQAALASTSKGDEPGRASSAPIMPANGNGRAFIGAMADSVRRVTASPNGCMLTPAPPPARLVVHRVHTHSYGASLSRRCCSEARKAAVPHVLSIQAEFPKPEAFHRPRSNSSLAPHFGGGRAPSPHAAVRPKGSAGRVWAHACTIGCACCADGPHAWAATSTAQDEARHHPVSALHCTHSRNPAWQPLVHVSGSSHAVSHAAFRACLIRARFTLVRPSGGLRATCCRRRCLHRRAPSQ
jgi:hypothetical protein